MAAISQTTFSNSFLDENRCVLIEISLKYAHGGSIYDNA